MSKLNEAKLEQAIITKRYVNDGTIAAVRHTTFGGYKSGGDNNL